MQHSSEGFRLSPQQRNVWSLAQAGDNNLYRAVCALMIEGGLEIEKLRRALEGLVNRHEILRTRFVRPTGIKMPFQVIGEDLRPIWRVVDLSGLEQAEQRAGMESYFDSEAQRPFDLEAGPVLRASLLTLSIDRGVLILSLPSMCSDSRTISNLVSELSHAYDGAELIAEPMQYADFAQWQNDVIEGDEAEPKAPLPLASAGAPHMPLEKRSPEGNELAFDSVAVELDQALLGRMNALAHAEKVSVSSWLFSLWQALVWRLSGQSDFVIFKLSEGRKVDDLKDALGLYAKYLPVRCHCEDASFSATLQAAAEAIEEADEWEEYFDPATVPSTSDHIAFEYEERPVEFAAGSVRFAIQRQFVFLQPFKLKLSCVRAGDKLAIELHYDARAFERETIESFAKYFNKIAKTLVSNADEESQTEVCATTIGAIDLLGDEERQRLLFDLNQTRVDYSQEKCIHQLFEEQVAKTPEAIALVFDDCELTFKELNARANQLAHYLRSKGGLPGCRVGLCTERDAEMIIGLLGILKAGGAYVPLNPEHPRARLELQLAESNASFLITNGDAIDGLGFAGKTINLVRDRALLETKSSENPECVVTPEDLVYVIYTSGSTGGPKGVAVRHRNLVNYTEFVLRSLRIDGPLHFATVSTITADLGNTCIFPSIVSGGCLHVLSYDVSMEGDLLRDYVEKHPIDVLKIVPSHLNALLASQSNGAILPKQYLILGGEALSWELVRRISQMEHSCKIINHYGPTETTVGSLTFGVESGAASKYSLTVPIGRPIANTRVYVLDGNLQPVPLGVTGELYIGGAGVAAGYLNQPMETAARFIADPFSERSGARLYRTGDLARYLPDDNIEFLGRVDHQVKVRGFRVELGEIESVLREHAGVDHAVVTVERDSSNGERIIAYIVSPTGAARNQDELRTFLRARIPDYMIPSAFVFLKSMPLTPNGKIDRAALATSAEASADLQRAFVAPRTAVEKELSNIWTELLKLNELSVHDNFFDLGGHSLLATQVVSRMRKAFQREIPLRALFESPTIAALAERIDNDSASETARLLAELEQLSDEEAERLLSLEHHRISST
jgi:amino acid adenylation domain-containing protein